MPTLLLFLEDEQGSRSMQTIFLASLTRFLSLFNNSLLRWNTPPIWNTSFCIYLLCSAILFSPLPPSSHFLSDNALSSVDVSNENYPIVYCSISYWKILPGKFDFSNSISNLDCKIELVLVFSPPDQRSPPRTFSEYLIRYHFLNRS